MSTTRIFNLSSKAIEIVFYFLLAIVPFIFVPQMSELFEVPKMLLVYGGTVLIVFFWLVKSSLAGKFLFRRTILDLPLLLFLLSQIASTWFSIDRHTSIWGYYSRLNGGLLSLISYCLLYWAWVSNMSIRASLRAIRFLLASSLVISVWGILEHFGHSPSCLVLKGNFGVSCWAPKVQERVFATLGQPNWLAAWLVMIAPLSWWWLTTRIAHSTRKTIVLLVTCYLLPSLLFAAILFTKSRSGLIAVAVAFLIFWSLNFLKFRFKYLKDSLVLGACFLVLIAVFGTPWTPSARNARAKFISRANQLQVTSQESPPVGGTESLDIRKIVWKGALDIWKAYPIFGSGVETFAYSYYNFRPVQHNLTSEWDLLYNKAHNEYLNYLANTGVVGLTTYVLLIGTFLVWALKRIKNHATPNPYFLILTSLTAGFVSLLITNYVGFSIASTSLLFFLFPAMAVTASTTKEVQHSLGKFTSLKKLFLFFVVCCMSYALFRVLALFPADIRYNQAKRLNELQEPQGAANMLDQALQFKPGEPRYYDELADSTSRLASTLAESTDEELVKTAPEIAELAKEISDKSIEISPKNVSFWSNRAIYFKRLASVDENYLKEAIKSLEEAVRLAPTEPSFLYNLAVLYEYSQQPKLALTTLKKAVELKPDYEDARILLNKLSHSE